MVGVNPYVGPRSFEAGETLYGRDREAAELQDLLIAERIVLLYSPSGAGKTSLLQAKLLPAMAAAGFIVRPVIRPGNEPSAPSNNRFVRASLDSLGGAAADTNLASYLGKPASAELLVFDQFEEVLTTDAGDRDAKLAFFTSLADVLRPRGRWALFAMREDYIAGLDPYLKLVPTRFAPTYRLDLLDRDRAIEAMREPARASGVDFTLPAAEKLADNLRRAGPYVEPVQLQVVCLRLWDKPRPNFAQIAAADVGGEGDIDQALASYYADCVASTVSPAAPERAIRDWFDRRLISKQGTRMQVLRGPEQDLDEVAIAALVNCHLVRSDQRHDTTWYELAHDRLIAPIQENNRQWREANLSPLQRQAELWDEQKRPDGALLRGAALAKAEAWAKHNTGLTPVERDFLRECRAERRRHWWRNVAIGMVGALGIAAIALFLWGAGKNREATANLKLANLNSEEANDAAGDAMRHADDAADAEQRANNSAGQAKDEARVATAGRLAATALLEKDRRPDLASLLAVAAYRTNSASDTVSSLLFTSQASPRLTRYLQNPATPQAVAFDPHANFLLTAGAAGLVQFWDPRTGRKTRELPSPCGAVQALAVSPDSKIVAAACRTTVALWRLPGANAQVLDGTAAIYRSIAFSPDGQLLAASGGNPVVRVWDAATGRLRPNWPDIGDSHGLAFSLDSKTLALINSSWINFFDTGTAKLVRTAATGLRAFDSLAYSPRADAVATTRGSNVAIWSDPLQPLESYQAQDAQNLTHIVFLGSPFLLAAIGDNNAINVWDENHYQLVLRSGIDQLDSLAYCQGARLLAASGGAIWNMGSDYLPSEWAHPIASGQNVTAIAFSPNGNTIAIAGTGFRPELWDVAARTRKLVFGTDSETLVPGFVAGGRQIVAADRNNIRFWDSISGAAAGPSISTSESLVDVALSPNGELLASLSLQGRLQLWSIASRKPHGEPLFQNVNTGNVGANRLSFSNDSAVAAVTIIEQLQLWDIAKRLLINHRAVGVVTATSFSFSPNGDRIALAGGGEVTISRTGDPGSVEARLAGHGGNIADVTFSPDGSTLATAGEDGSVRLWDIHGLPLGDPLIAPTDQVNHAMRRVAFSPNGNFLAAAGQAGVFLLPTAPNAWAQRNCARANRNLTMAEWKQYAGDIPYENTCPDLPLGLGSAGAKAPAYAALGRGVKEQ